MKNQTVLITGALTGIGRATAIAFAGEGAKIVVSGRHEDKGRGLVAELRSLRAEAEFIKADVRHEEDVKNLIDETVKRFGRLDVAVNNAGTEGRAGPIIEQTAETYSQVFDTNVLVLTCIKARNNIYCANEIDSYKIRRLRARGAPILDQKWEDRATNELACPNHSFC